MEEERPNAEEVKEAPEAIAPEDFLKKARKGKGEVAKQIVQRALDLAASGALAIPFTNLESGRVYISKMENGHKPFPDVNAPDDWYFLRMAYDLTDDELAELKSHCQLQEYRMEENAPKEQEELTNQDELFAKIFANEEDDPAKALEREEEVQKFREAFELLGEDLRRVVRLRYGLDGERVHSLEEMREIFGGISTQAVDQKITKAIGEIKYYCGQEGKVKRVRMYKKREKNGE